MASRRFANMGTTPITHIHAHPTVFTDLAGLSAESSSAPARGIADTGATADIGVDTVVDIGAGLDMAIAVA